MFQFIPVHEADIFAVRVSGKLTHKDYQAFIPELDSLLADEGQISLLIELDEFHGADLAAIKDDLNFITTRQDAFRKIAIVGDKKWQQWMTLLSKPFLKNEMAYFKRQDLAKAWDWLREVSFSHQELADLPINPYQKIMVGIDFSPYSEHAARRAIALAKGFDAELQLVYIVNEAALYDFYFDATDLGLPMTEYSMQVMGLGGNLMDYLVEKASLRMAMLCEELGLKKESGIVLTGKPTTTLISYAEAQGIDLIVIGTRGRNLATLIGSSTRYVQQHARCEVLSVPLVES